MPIERLGYACINETLKKDGITTNRSMIKRTFLAKGIEYASELSLLNARSILPILQWNEQHGIKFFRLSSDMFPWASEFDCEDMPDWLAISDALAEAGSFARANGHRLTMHPGPFNCLASKTEKVILNSIKDLTNHGIIMDALGQPRTPEAKINIHVGGAYGEHDRAMERFCKNFERLPESVRTRLTVENDDRPNMFNVTMLHRGIHDRIGIPIVFDSLHFQCGPEDIPKQEALNLALSTWPDGVTPVCHHSSSKKLHEDASVKSSTAHAGYLYDPFETDKPIDLMLECKAKELALLKYREDYLLT